MNAQLGAAGEQSEHGRVSLMTGFGLKTRLLRRAFPMIALASLAIPCAQAAEHITLSNGFDLVCDHRVADGSRIRLYMDESNFV